MPKLKYNKRQNPPGKKEEALSRLIKRSIYEKIKKIVKQSAYSANPNA